MDVEAHEWLPFAQALGVRDGFGASARPAQDRAALRLLRGARLLLFELHFFDHDDFAFGALVTKFGVLEGLRALGFRPYYARENHSCQNEKHVPCFEAGFINTALEEEEEEEEEDEKTAARGSGGGWACSELSDPFANRSAT